MRCVRLTKAVLLALLAGLLILTFVHAADEESVGEDEKRDITFGDDQDLEDDDEGEDDVDGGSEDKKDEPAVLNVGEDVEYTTEKPSGLNFVEDFQGDWASVWTHSEKGMYAGKFNVGTGANPEISGDKGLIIPIKARHYAISTVASGLDDLSDSDLVLQYEVRLDEGMTCGGAYLKLPTSDFKDPSSFDESVKYSIMFGPDKCGSTDKVHFIFQSKNPVTGKYVEHHLKAPPSVASTDKNTHLYSLIVRKDKTFDIMIDGESKKTGSLSKDFEPPVQQPEEIDDKDDKKPDDWVDEKKIPDPEAKKPDDWDEDEPEKIEDESATKPDEWDESAPSTIPDPEAVRPESWNDEKDGEWVPKQIPNPACNNGCGPWKPPMISNPKYKGKWSPPLIDNPKYIGEWKPRKIPNPEYYKVEEVSLLGVGGVGIEIWTMDQGVVFDNIVLGKDPGAAKQFADATWRKKQEKAAEAARKHEDKDEDEDEKKIKDKKTWRTDLTGFLGKVDRYLDTFEEFMNPVEDTLRSFDWVDLMFHKMDEARVERKMLVVIAVPLLIVLVFILFRTRGKKPASVVDAEAKKTDKKTKDDVAPDTAQTAQEDTESISTAVTADMEKKTTEPTLRKRKTATAE